MSVEPNCGIKQSTLERLGLDPKLITQTPLGRIYDGDIDWSNLGLTALPPLFYAVRGDFNCGDNKLTSLAGAPRIVENFDCRNNLLTSLAGAPDFIAYNFWCMGNPTLVDRTMPPGVREAYFEDRFEDEEGYVDRVPVRHTPRPPAPVAVRDMRRDADNLHLEFDDGFDDPAYDDDDDDPVADVGAVEELHGYLPDDMQDLDPDPDGF